MPCRPNARPVLAGRASPAPPKAPASPRYEGVQGASRILAAQPKLLSPGELCGSGMHGGAEVSRL